jgi:hypothetical protein
MKRHTNRVILGAALALAFIGCDDGGTGGQAAAGDDAAAAGAGAGGAGATDGKGMGGGGEGRDAGTAPDAAVPIETQACENEGTPGATARCLRPTFPPEHYVEQALKYFDTLDVTADPESIPDYSDLVARWEWPPWLLLTGYGRDAMISTSNSLRELDPSTVPERDCRFFEEQPFARCYIVFEYDEGPCPIYEEFIFNDQGEMTWIEAWSDLPGLRPDNLENDRWGEAPDFYRLGTLVPGLGNATGRVDIESEWMRAAGEANPDVADFALRATDWWQYWARLLAESPRDFFAQGCGWGSE